MAVPRASRIAFLAASLLACSTSAFSQEQAKKQHVPLQKTIGEAHSDRPVPSLAVLNAAGAKLDGAKLVLTGVSANTIVFADRPVRAAGHETTRQFLMQWDEDKGTFSQDPPNATVSVLGANPGEVSDAVLVLKTPTFDGTTLTFDVSVLEGSLETGGPWQCSSTPSPFVALMAAALPMQAAGAARQRFAAPTVVALPMSGAGAAPATGTLRSIMAPGMAIRATAWAPLLPGRPSERRSHGRTIHRPPAATTPIRLATERRRDTQVNVTEGRPIPAGCIPTKDYP